MDRPPNNGNQPYSFVPFGAQNVSPYAPMFFAPSQSMPNIPRMFMVPPSGQGLQDPSQHPMMMGFFPAPQFLAHPGGGHFGEHVPQQAFNHMYPPMFFGYPQFRPEAPRGPTDLVGQEIGAQMLQMVPPDPAQPNVVQLTQEPLYMNGEDTEDQGQQAYANEGPNYTNEDIAEEPSYMNNRIHQPRGVSVPPVFDEASAPSPIPPPRSRRGSQLSLNQSTHSLNMMGLEESVRNLKETMKLLKDRHPVDRAKDPPRRPPRRKDRLKRASTFATLPRNFKSHELDDILEDEQARRDEKEANAKVPMPGTVPPEEVRIKLSPFMQEKPLINQPGTPDDSETRTSDSLTPSIPMPGASPGFTNESLSPTIPFPGLTPDLKSPQLPRNPLGLAVPSLATIPMPERPIVQILEEEDDIPFLPTVPMPDPGDRQISAQQPHQLSALNPSRGLLSTFNSYTDEEDIVRPPVPIILHSTLTISPDTGETRLQQTASPAPRLPELTMDHHYEDLDNNATQAGKSGSDTDYEDIDQASPPKAIPDDDYDEVEFKTGTNLIPEDGTGEKEGSDRSGQSNNSIIKTRKELLAGIREMDRTIQSLKIGIVKVYEDVFPKAVYAIPVKKSQRSKSEGPPNPHESNALDRDFVEMSPDLTPVEVIEVQPHIQTPLEANLQGEARSPLEERSEEEDMQTQCEDQRLFGEQSEEEDMQTQFEDQPLFGEQSKEDFQSQAETQANYENQSVDAIQSPVAALPQFETHPDYEFQTQMEEPHVELDFPGQGEAENQGFFANQLGATALEPAQPSVDLEASPEPTSVTKVDSGRSFRQAFYGIKPPSVEEFGEDDTNGIPNLEDITGDDNTLLVAKSLDANSKSEGDIPDNVSDTGTETLDVTLEIPECDEEPDEVNDHIYDDENDEDETIAEFLDDQGQPNQEPDPDTSYRWEEIMDNDSGLPIPLMLQERLRSLKLDLLSSIFQNLYPTNQDCYLVNRFISCPASLEEKYSMMRLGDILRKNKRMGVELECLAEAMGQLARIGQELMKPEEERNPLWRSIPVAKEITVSRGIAQRAPWEKIQGGTEILESLGYTEYTGFALQYPRAVVPEYFADHIGNLTVELVLAVVEISTLIVHVPPTLESLWVLQESEPFPGNDPEAYYPDAPMLENVPQKASLEPQENKYSNTDISNAAPLENLTFSDETENGSHNGMVGMVERGEVDIALPEISYTLDRNLVSDFPFAMSKEYQRIIVRNTFTQSSLDFTTYINPYSSGFWWVTLVTTLSCVLLVNLFHVLDHEEDQSWIQDLIYVFIGIGISGMPSRLSARIFFLSCAILGFLFISSYTSILSATLIVKYYTYPFRDINEVANYDGSSVFLIRNGSAAHTFYASSLPGTIANKLWKRGQLFNSVPEAVELVKDSSNYLMQAATGDYQFLADYPCAIYDMKWNAMTDLTGLIMTKDSRYTSLFREFFLLLDQSGQLRRLEKKWLEPPLKGIQDCQSGSALGIHKCISAFLVLALGVGGSLLVICIENLLKFDRLKRLRAKWTSSPGPIFP